MIPWYKEWTDRIYILEQCHVQDPNEAQFVEQLRSIVAASLKTLKHYLDNEKKRVLDSIEQFFDFQNTNSDQNLRCNTVLTLV